MNPYVYMLILLACVLGTAASLGGTIIQPLAKYVRDQNDLIVKCQENLPRNQFCVIKAVPVKEGEE